jgi:hypothetical protein
MSNPAARLHAILSRAKSVAQGEGMIQGWRHCLQVNKEVEDLEVMSKVGLVFTLPTIITSQVERFPELTKDDLYVGWKNELTDAFRIISFQSNFGQFSTRLSESLLVTLRFCAHALDQRLPEKEIAPEQINELRDAVWGLYGEVEASGLAPDLIRYALDHLFLIIQALDNYEIMGGTGVGTALNTVIGAVVTQPEISRKFSQSELGEKFWKTMGRIAVALSLGKTAYELIDAGVKTLGH